VSSTFPKTLMVLLLCLTFFGQAMAATVMSYHMMNMKGMSSQQSSNMANMANMDHSGHSMMNDSAEDNSSNESEECCAKSCNCFTGSCSSIATLVRNLSIDAVIDYSERVHSTSTLAQGQQLTSLYRPPIFS